MRGLNQCHAAPAQFTARSSFQKPAATHNWWHIMMDLDTTDQDAKRDNRIGPSGVQTRRPGRDDVAERLDREIEALIPRLTRYARALTHDAVAADDLVQDCL